MIGNISALNKPMLGWKISMLAEPVSCLLGDPEGQRAEEKCDSLASKCIGWTTDLWSALPYQCLAQMHKAGFCSEVSSQFLRDYP